MRIGTLGAARITPKALLEPAAAMKGVEVVAVAARDERRAEAFAQAHGIGKVHRSYANLLADDGIDAVYNPLPNSEHAEWSMRALAAGKHVLCEKPLAMNAEECDQMITAAARSGRILMEALHWRYHPAAARMIALARELGPLERAESVFLTEIADEGDIRYQLALGGGAMMDLGCYTLHWLRAVAGEEPVVRSATAVERPEGIDVSMDAELSFPSGLEARLRCSFEGPRAAVRYLVVEGRNGRMRMENPLAPQEGNRLTAELSDGRSIDEQLTLRSSYLCQLEAFVEAARTGVPPLTSGAEALANQKAIDAVYLAAGLPLR